MESILAEPVKNKTQSFVNFVENEAQYLCCFNSYGQEYEHAEKRLNAKLKDVRRIIDQARGVSPATSVALQWTREAEELIDANTKKEKCFNDLCINCWRQYQKGKDLAKRTLDIDKLLERSNFDIVASPIELPGIKYRCLPNFMPFDSRKSTFEKLKKALEDEKNIMIGLQGLGGTGKTSMATEVGAKLEGSIFRKVIFLVVSKLPDFKKLQGEIARNLGVELKNGAEEVLHDKILAKIKALEEKILIVLDDVWMEFDLTKELGIPPRHLHKGCTILITTRSKEICTKMDCQGIIDLHKLTDKEALSLFLEHTNSSSTLESLAQNIVDHCHGVPVVIVAVARSLKGRPSLVWKEALRNLQRGETIFRVRDDDLKGVYEGLKLSYDNLKNEKAKRLLLISSLFPEDFEIPMEFLIRIGVGMGPFGEVDDYNERRRKVLDAIVELLDSSLLLNTKRECVKMHDLIHEVSLSIGEKDVQSVIESKPPKEGLQCLFWKSNSFPRHFDGRNLEVLLWVLNNSKDLEVPNTFFTVMKKLKVWFLCGEGFYQISAPSLFPSIQSLQNIQTLMIGNFALCHSISMLGRLPNLESLWFDDCSISKSPGENFELEKLRFLRIENCEIDMSNPFELIEACPKLEELTFLSNQYDEGEIEKKIFHKASFHTLQIYQISCDGQDEFLDYFEQCGSLSRCFKPSNLRHLISEATFKQLVKTAELLILEGYGETKQKNLVLDIVPVDNKGRTDLIILQLDSWPDMRCLIDVANNRLDVKNAFSNLVGLYLSEMGLSNILFNGHYNLCHLKTLKLNGCPKLTSIFLPFTAQRLLQLEELNIERCDALECIVEDKSSRGEIAGGDGDNDQKSYDTLFPKFKILKIDSCDNLEIILPILHGGWPLERIIIRLCKKLKYIFDKFQEVNVMLPSLEEMQLFSLSSLVGVFREYEKSTSSSPQRPVPTPPSTKIRSFSWAQVCCFESKATSEEADVAVSTGRLLDEGISRGLLASKKWIDTAPTIGRQLALHVVGHIRKMELAYLSSNSVSTLFTLSMASVISWEEMTIRGYDGLKHLATSEEDDYKDQINCSSIFPKLQKLHISGCRDLEFLFLSAISIEIKNLKSLTIEGAPQLTYVIEKYQHQHHLSHQNQNDEWHFDLPALEVLCLDRVPKFISIGPMNYKSQLDLNTTKGLLESKKWIDAAPTLGRQLALHVRHIKKMELACFFSDSVSTLFTLSMASVIEWEELTIRRYDGLKHLVMSEEDDYKDEINCSSIFPKLQKLHISECMDLEFLFLSAISIEIKNLKSLTIEGTPQLTYVIEKYQHQHHLSHLNQKDEWHFDLPALDVLCLGSVPKFLSIGPMNYKAQLDLNTTKVMLSFYGDVVCSLRICLLKSEI
ncbi:disease resistance protein At4g27190-like [Neltuma alba]|uniref:disease resistance protein At4g27190-like n=1 Tax=Neltuma alba TaxID=207710 RepID=UPI0010A46254|nr:disease resistance protein At4g27190-like [Prosopis alba]